MGLALCHYLRSIFLTLWLFVLHSSGSSMLFCRAVQYCRCCQGCERHHCCSCAKEWCHCSLSWAPLPVPGWADFPLSWLSSGHFPGTTEQLVMTAFCFHLFPFFHHYLMNKRFLRKQRSCLNSDWTNGRDFLGLQRFFSQALIETLQIQFSSNDSVNHCLFLGSSCSFILD